LRRGVHDRVWANLGKQFQDSWTVANVDCVVMKVLQGVPETPGVPGGVTLWSKKLGPHVIVYPVHLPLIFRKKGNYFAADQTTRAGDQNFLHGCQIGYGADNVKQKPRS